MKLHWLNYWMLIHTILFWGLIFTALFKVEGLVEVEYATLIQLWIWNLFAYLYLAFANYLRIKKMHYKKLEVLKIAV